MFIVFLDLNDGDPISQKKLQLLSYEVSRFYCDYTEVVISDCQGALVLGFSSGFKNRLRWVGFLQTLISLMIWIGYCCVKAKINCWRCTLKTIKDEDPFNKVEKY